MLDSTREILELFIENAHELEATQFVKYLREGKPISLKISKEDDSSLLFELIGPDEPHRNDALILIRLFTSKSEPISIRKVGSLCNDPGLSEKWKNRIRAIRNKTNGYLDDQFMESEDQDFRLTRREIFNTFMNGKKFHLNDEIKRKRYSKWASDDFFFKLLYTEMNSILDFLCLTIITISTITKEELANNLKRV